MTFDANVIRPFMLPKDYDSIGKHRLTVCAGQRPLWHATPDIIRPGVIAKVHEGMPCEMLSDHVCCTIAMKDCHVQRHYTMCATQGLCGHATPDVVRSCVLSKGDDNMPCPMSSRRMCCLMEIMACHTRCHPFVCATQGLCGHATLDVVRPCL